MSPWTGAPRHRKVRQAFPVSRPGGTIVGVIGRLHHVVLDCRDPRAAAAFWSALLGLPVTYADDDWVVVAASDRSSGLAFQRSPDVVPPTWPDPQIPQQLHLDVMVDDVEAACAAAIALGAEPRNGVGVLVDPAGHPFCLIPRPGWAPPVSPSGPVVP